MTPLQQEIVGVVGSALALLGMALALWLFWRGGGRKTHIRVTINVPNKKVIAAVLGEKASPKDSRVFRISVRNRGPSDVQVPKWVDKEWPAMRPHLDLPLGYHVEHITRLGVAQERPDPNFDLPLSVVPLQYMANISAQQRIYINIHRLRAGRVSRIYFSCSRHDLIAPEMTGPPWTFTFYRGWIQDVQFSGGYDGFARCDGHDQQLESI